METKKLFLNGAWRVAAKSFEVRSPFSNEILANVAQADADEMEEAISAAENAAKEMRKLARFEIAAGLRKIAEGIRERQTEFTETIAQESAKPVKTARGEV